MGVKLQGIIVREKLNFQKLAGKIIAIDAPNIVMGLFTFSMKSSKLFLTNFTFNKG